MTDRQRARESDRESRCEGSVIRVAGPAERLTSTRSRTWRVAERPLPVAARRQRTSAAEASEAKNVCHVEGEVELLSFLSRRSRRVVVLVVGAVPVCRHGRSRRRGAAGGASLPRGATRAGRAGRAPEARRRAALRRSRLPRAQRRLARRALLCSRPAWPGLGRRGGPRARRPGASLRRLRCRPHLQIGRRARPRRGLAPEGGGTPPRNVAPSGAEWSGKETARAEPMRDWLASDPCAARHGADPSAN